MEYKKSRWELKYEALKNGRIDNEVESLKDKKKQLADNMVEAYKNGKSDDVKKMQDEMRNTEMLQNQRSAHRTTLLFKKLNFFPGSLRYNRQIKIEFI